MLDARLARLPSSGQRPHLIGLWRERKPVSWSEPDAGVDISKPDVFEFYSGVPPTLFRGKKQDRGVVRLGGGFDQQCFPTHYVLRFHGSLSDLHQSP
jgi:hypothetical protein